MASSAEDSKAPPLASHGPLNRVTPFELLGIFGLNEVTGSSPDRQAMKIAAIARLQKSSRCTLGLALLYLSLGRHHPTGFQWTLRSAIAVCVRTHPNVHRR